MINTMTILHTEVANRKLNDDGRNGDAFELSIRSYIAKRRYRTVKRQGVEDIKSKGIKIEIKTACGTVNDTLKADVVIYCPLVDDSIPAEKQGFVFTHEKWVDMLNGVGYSGKGSVIKQNKSRNTWNIQSFYGSEMVRPKASKKLADYIWNCCFECPTVEEWVAMRQPLTTSNQQPRRSQSTPPPRRGEKK